MFSHPPFFITCTSIRFIPTALLLCSLAGCGGGVLKFTAGADASLRVQENTAGTVWKAQVTLDGPGSLAGLNYTLGGLDQDRFLINTVTGDVSFREAADYEQPMDLNKDNEYRLSIVARANNQTAEQQLVISVENSTLPKIQLVTPRLNENLAQKTDTQVNALVRLYDAESDSTLDSGSVYVNGRALLQDANNPQLFRGEITVPAAGMDIRVQGTYGSRQTVSVQGKLFNKLSAVSPDYFGVNPGQYLFYLDRADSSVSKLPLDTATSFRYIQNYLFLNANPIADFNSLYQTVYTVVESDVGRQELYAFNVDTASPKYYSAGCTADKILSIHYDGLNKRVLLVTQAAAQSNSGYTILSLAVSESEGFVNSDKRGDCNKTMQPVTVSTLSTELIKGKFKQLVFHRLSGTYVVADERMQAGRAVTVLQGFSEAGEKRFEAIVGPDISNITINNPMGIIYVAEHHSSAEGKIKAINVANGEVSDLLTTLGDNYLGAYSDIRIDNPNQLLYIADAVSDDYFVVNLATNTLTNLHAKRIPDVVSD